MSNLSRAKSIASEQPDTLAAGAGAWRRGVAGGGGEGALGRKQGHCKERTGEKEVLWREEGKEGQGERVRGIRGGS